MVVISPGDVPPAEPTAEDRFLARFAQDYVDFIRVRPWYEYDFVGEMRRLWTETPAWGPGVLRKWERRYALTTEIGLKAIYGWLLGKVTQASYGEAGGDTAVVVDHLPKNVEKELPTIKVMEKKGDGSAVVIVPRYAAFKTHALALAQQGASIREVAGNRGPILLSVLGPSGASLPGVALFRQPIITDPGRERTVLTVPVPSLSHALLRLNRSGIEVEHVFDY